MKYNGTNYLLTVVSQLRIQIIVSKASVSFKSLFLPEAGIFVLSQDFFPTKKKVVL